MFDIILIALSVTTVPFVLILIIGALVLIHKRVSIIPRRSFITQKKQRNVFGINVLLMSPTV